MFTFQLKHLGAILTGCMLLFMACPDPIIAPEQTLEITADYVSAKEVWLGVRFQDSIQPRGLVIKRDGVAIYSVADAPSNVLFRDSSLTPNRSYSYSAERPDKQNDKPASMLVTTSDTTNHFISWQIDTIASDGLIRDVWIFDSNNIWAVGEIQVDSSGSPLFYGFAFWDGAGWTLGRKDALEPSGAPVNLQPRGIFAFSPTDIWLAGGGVYHWNGSTMTPYWINPFGGNPSPILSEGQTAEKVWGTSSSNIFAVGRGGAIAHFNGTTWTKMESGTTVGLEDIWGIDGNHIWASGRSDADGRSIVLAYSGSTWKTIYDNTTKPPPQQFGFNTVWTDNPRSIHLTGSGSTAILHGPSETVYTKDTGKEYFSYHIRGTSPADLFISGQGSELLHFNGSSWYLYPEIAALGATNTAGWLRIHARENVVAVGGLIVTGLTSAPVVLRGNR
ncbi:MAG: hypothetical protein WEB33_02870 [Bacteroidota bacterium]